MIFAGQRDSARKAMMAAVPGAIGFEAPTATKAGTSSRPVAPKDADPMAGGGEKFFQTTPGTQPTDDKNYALFGDKLGINAGTRYARGRRNINTDYIREYGFSPAAAITGNGRDPDVLSTLEAYSPGVTARATFEYASGGNVRNPMKIHVPQYKIAPRNPEYYYYGQPSGDFNEQLRSRIRSRRSNMASIRSKNTSFGSFF